MPRVDFEQLWLFDVGPDMAKLRRSSVAFQRAKRAPSTRVAYASDWAAFECWCTAAGRAPLPASAETVALYATARLEDSLRASTVERHIAAVAFHHKTEGAAVAVRAHLTGRFSCR